MSLLNFGMKSRLKNNMAASGDNELLPSGEAPSTAENLDLQKAKDSSMSDLIRALSDQFSNIDPNNAMDLSAVGTALSEIPAEMPGLTDGFTSFREEVLTSLLFEGDNDQVVSRVDKLRGCLDSVAAPEKSLAVEELQVLISNLVGELEVTHGDEKAQGDAIDGYHSDLEPPSVQSRLARAERMQEATTSAREYFASDVGGDVISVTESRGVENSTLDLALRSVAEASVQAVANSLQEQEEQLKIYRDTCEKLVKARERMVEAKNCFEFVEEGFTGEGLSSAVGGTHYQWLSDLVDQFRSEQESYDRICEEKAAAVTEQISVLQSESDQLGTAVRKLGAETLEPPQSVLQSLTGSNLSGVTGEDGELDYEESITQYIDWVTTQRESIRELKKEMARVDQQMLDAEREVDEAFSAKLSSALRQKEETNNRLSNARREASKDYEEAEALVAGLTSDADEILAGVNRLADARSKFIRDVEDSITKTMIKLGEVLYEGNARAKVDGKE